MKLYLFSKNKNNVILNKTTSLSKRKTCTQFTAFLNYRQNYKQQVITYSKVFHKINIIIKILFNGSFLILRKIFDVIMKSLLNTIIR